MCRVLLDEFKYKVTIKIENTEKNTESLFSAMISRAFAAFLEDNHASDYPEMELAFNFDEHHDMDQMFEDLGISLTNLNPVVLNAE